MATNRELWNIPYAADAAKVADLIALEAELRERSLERSAETRNAVLKDLNDRKADCFELKIEKDAQFEEASAKPALASKLRRTITMARLSVGAIAAGGAAAFFFPPLFIPAAVIALAGINKAPKYISKIGKLSDSAAYEAQHGGTIRNQLRNFQMPPPAIAKRSLQIGPWQIPLPSKGFPGSVLFGKNPTVNDQIDQAGIEAEIRVATKERDDAERALNEVEQSIADLERNPVPTVPDPESRWANEFDQKFWACHKLRTQAEEGLLAKIRRAPTSYRSSSGKLISARNPIVSALGPPPIAGTSESEEWDNHAVELAVYMSDTLSSGGTIGRDHVLEANPPPDRRDFRDQMFTKLAAFRERLGENDHSILLPDHVAIGVGL